MHLGLACMRLHVKTVNALLDIVGLFLFQLYVAMILLSFPYFNFMLLYPPWMYLYRMGNLASEDRKEVTSASGYSRARELSKRSVLYSCDMGPVLWNSSALVSKQWRSVHQNAPGIAMLVLQRPNFLFLHFWLWISFRLGLWKFLECPLDFWFWNLEFGNEGTKNLGKFRGSFVILLWIRPATSEQNGNISVVF